MDPIGTKGQQFRDDAATGRVTGLALPLYGPAQLEVDGRPMPLRVKALAILYYLALHGATHREELATLLWKGAASRQNLRVNLHGLRRTLAGQGYIAFPDAGDPVKLPSIITVHREPREGQPLAGLDGLSSEYQSWLETERAKLSAPTKQVPLKRATVRAAATDITVPSVIVLQTPPGGHSLEFAQELARLAGLPFVEGLGGNGVAVRFLQNIEGLDRRILLDALDHIRSVWVLERPLYGQDSRMLLEIRSRYPAERLRFLELPATDWPELRMRLLPTFGFDEAATLFLDSCGEPRYLRELLSMTSADHSPLGLPVPHRIRAAYELHVRELSADAQLALKRLSVHPDTLPESLIHASASGTSLYELESHGWLVYDNVWRLNRAVAQRVIYNSLPPGQRMQFHDEAASVLARGDHRIAVAYHRSQIQQPVDTAAVLRRTAGWQKATISQALGIAAPLAALPAAEASAVGSVAPTLEGTQGPGIQVEGTTMRFWRTADDAATTRLRWTLPIPETIVRLRGSALVRNPLGIGLHGDYAPLRVRIPGSTVNIVLCDVAEPGLLDGDVVLPLQSHFEYLLRLPATPALVIESRARAAVIELDLAVLHPTRSPHRSDPAHAGQETAFDLSELAGKPAGP